MTKSATPPDAELSRRTKRLEKLTERFGDPFELTRFGKTHAAKQIKDEYGALPASIIKPSPTASSLKGLQSVWR